MNTKVRRHFFDAIEFFVFHHDTHSCVAFFNVVYCRNDWLAQAGQTHPRYPSAESQDAKEI